MSRNAVSQFELVTSETRQAGPFADDVIAGLTSTPKQLPSHWFYDEIGSRLFEEICELPEYYLTRCERGILEHRAPEIAARFPAESLLVELGSGSASKTRLLIEAFLQRHGRLVFAPIDISQSMLEQSARLLLRDYARLEILAFAGRYESGLSYLADRDRTRNGPVETRSQLILWLGSSVGNLDRHDAAEFLRTVRQQMTEGDRLLIGIDLRKDGAVLERAYDDADGVTAQFDLNLLARINREFGARFDLERFEHHATWVEGPGRVESHLVSRVDQTVWIDDLDLEVGFEAGETIHTENSYKYSRAEIDSLARGAGMRAEDHWQDDAGLYSLNLFAPA